MIKFFRRIRQRLLRKSNFSKYLLYAIGEIILVVIGILIALQINNWNEAIKNAKTEQEFYKEILSDLEKDNIKLEGLTEFYNNRIEHAGWLLKKVRKPIGSIDKLEFGQHVEPLYIGPIPVVFNSSGYLEIAVYKSNCSTVGSASTLMGLKTMDTVTVNFSKT